jgi:septal ring factor EnvC (AmiA/AmiB activator)
MHERSSVRRAARRSFALVTVTLSAMLMVASPVGGRGPCWPVPVAGTVVDPYREPPCVWCPGNRGIEYQTRPGGVVRSVAAGVVSFSGEVAGERYLVVELATGWKLTYGRIASTTFVIGDAVLGGSIVARTSDRFFFGLRIDDEYADPAPYLGVEIGRRRLVPTDGRLARPAPAPTLRCGAAGATES